MNTPASVLEKVLKSHPAILSSSVEYKEKQEELIVFITSREEEEKKQNALLEKEKVHLWSKVYDMSYSKTAEEADPDFNTGIWTSNYSGQLIPTEQMKEWVSVTVKRILDTHTDTSKKPSILEIGCGTGLLLYSLLPFVEEYTGTDISEEAVELIQENCKGKKDASKLKLFVADADDLSGLPRRQYDIIVINSVIQYFPSADYLFSVIKGLKPYLNPTGTIFIGDVICFPLRNAFYYETQFSKSPAEKTCRELMETIERLKTSKGSETFYDPRFFHLLSKQLNWIDTVETQLRKGSFYNEMNNFRFDVLLKQSSATPPQPTTSVTILDWEKDGLTLEKLQTLLNSGSEQTFHIKHVPNARTIRSKKIIELLADSNPEEKVGQLKERLNNELILHPGMEPSVFWNLENQNYRIEVDWDYEQWEGSMYVRCIKKNTRSLKYKSQGFSISECSNWPAVNNTESTIIKDLQSYISQNLTLDLQTENIFVISSEMHALFKE